ncbi:MAG TPA: TonB-dependent receptor [Gemmatimonadales bacterium]
MNLAPVLLASLSIFAQDTTTQDSVVRLREVVVSATRSTETERIEQPAAVSVSVPSGAKRAASKVAANLLDEVTGVQVQQTSAGQGAIILRGLIGNQVLLLVDGVPLNNGTYRDGPGQYLATIDPETIERIEVIRGPASVMYGSDAQGGVVDLITRPHPLGSGRSVRLALSGNTNDRGFRTRISTGMLTPKVDLSFGGTFQTFGDAQAGGALGRQVPTAFDAYGLDGAVTFRPNARHGLTAVMQHFRMDSVPRYDRVVDFRAPARGSDFFHVFDPQARQLTYLRYTHRPGGMWLTRLEVTASLAMQREARKRIRLDGGVPDSILTTWHDDVYTPGIAVVGGSMAMVGPRLVSFTWGMEAYRDVLRSSGSRQNLLDQSVTPLPDGNYPSGAVADRLGVFLSADVQLIERLLLSVGGRWSRFRNEADVGADFGGLVENPSSALTGQVGLVLAPATGWRVAARVAEGFRAPNLYDLTRAGPVPGGVSLPNPDAVPEVALSGELSVRYSGHGSAVEVTGYVTRIRDFIDRAPGTFQGDTLFDGERVFQGVNIGTARVRGVEAEGAHRIGPVRLRATVLYTIGDQVGASGIDEPMAKIPPLGGTAALQWQGSGFPAWIEYVFRWATQQDRLGSRDLGDPRIPPGGTPGYAVHGVRAGLTLSDDIDVSAGFENIGDTLYRSHASGVDAPGRHLWLGVAWTGSF